MSTLPEIVSFGGGVNSTALILGLHEMGLKPFAILFADTGGEKPGTYAHVEAMRKWCDEHGMPTVTRVAQKITLQDDCFERGTLPGKAFGFGSCSDRFKIQPQRKWLKDNGIAECMWLAGIHAGEKRRAERTWNQRKDVRFPLIEWDWGRRNASRQSCGMG